jgi:signal transduction histidine kinase
MNSKNILLMILFYSSILFALWLLSSHYLLFHAYAEGFSIVIAIVMFIITWNSRHVIDNYYLYFIGLTYLFVANFDFLHTLGYSGMNVFPDYDFYANQLWVVGRYMESISLLLGFYFLKRKKRVNAIWVMVIYAIISTIFILLILVFKVFPECFIEGVGQTPFKIVSELIIIGILSLAIVGLYKNKDRFPKAILYSLLLSFIVTIISELFFTIYIHNYGISNILGHFAKIVSFYLIYRSIIKTGINEPYQVIFNNLNEKKMELQRLNEEKTQLFSVLAHDLRNPFNGLLNLSQIIYDEYDELPPEELKTFIKDIYVSSRSLFTITDNLLEWSRINLENLNIKRERVRLLEIIQKTQEMLKLPLESKRIKLVPMGLEDVTLMADKQSLFIIFRNIISNAMKFSFENSRIEITHNDLGQEVQIEIKDYGIGMTKHKLKSLSNSLITSTPGTQHETGTGLGINIIKKHLELNQGKMTIKSVENEGTTVVLSFPKKL